jgi:hypothetical protein
MIIVSDASKIVVVGGEVEARPKAAPRAEKPPMKLVVLGGEIEPKSRAAMREEQDSIRFGPSNSPIRSELATRSLIGDGTKLFVNGKERKIGKKSQYLLDMLTLED